jgi:hypothetical protein
MDLKTVNRGSFIAIALVTGLAMPALAATYYVAPSGNNSNPGTLAQPFATMAQGQSAAQAGDTVYLRGGEYLFSSSSDEIGINLTKNGASGRRIHYFAYPGETPVLNFSGMTAAKRIKGVNVSGDWLHLRGIEMKNVPQTPRMGKENWCIYINGGSNNIFERLDLHHNMGPGLFIIEGADNLVLNCDSHNNYDAESYSGGSSQPGENADGFGAHVKSPSSTGNIFRGCRAWWNADDGFDFINCATAVVVENSWAWLNGYKAGTTQSAGNGAGFKMGGYGMPPSGVPSDIPRHVLRKSLAFLNKAHGVYQNHHPIANIFHNNTSYNNRSSNYNLLGYDMGRGADANMAIVRNNIAFTGTAVSNGSGSGIDQANNSWNLSVTVSAADFVSTDTAGVAGPRNADGSLPNIGFMKLRADSDLIDKGADIGLVYNGAAPDLGAFEHGGTTKLGIVRKPDGRGGFSSALRAEGVGAHDASGRHLGSRSRAPVFLLQP